MGQSVESGREAAQFGRLAALRTADLLGAALGSEKEGNLIRVHGDKAVIKSARLGNPFIGITKAMLPKLDAAYIVLERDGSAGLFDIFYVNRQFLLRRQHIPASGSKEHQWFYRTPEIRKYGSKVAPLELRSRRYWVTTHWPHRANKSADVPHSGIYLPDGREKAGAALQPGDLVAIYESKSGRDLVRKDVSGNTTVVKSHKGKQGVVALVRVTSRLTASGDVQPQTYSDGSKIWWRWRADTEPYLSSGFLGRGELNTILGYAVENPLKGFGDLHSGLKEVSASEFSRIEEKFKEVGHVPEIKKAVTTTRTVKWGSGKEGELHKRIKEAVSADPSGLLREKGLRTIGMEYPFPTGDRADILLEDSTGRVIGVEVEPTVDDHELPGILQAIKYRYMGALMRNKRFADSRSFLVSTSFTPLARKICEAYEVECFVVDLTVIGAK